VRRAAYELNGIDHTKERTKIDIHKRPSNDEIPFLPADRRNVADIDDGERRFEYKDMDVEVERDDYDDDDDAEEDNDDDDNDDSDEEDIVSEDEDIISSIEKFIIFTTATTIKNSTTNLFTIEV
jgi:hypothetical protein